MALEVKAPSPGESVVEVEIGSWFVSDGQYVERDTRLAEILSDKASLDLYSEAAGQVKILHQAGQVVAIDTVIATIDTAAAGGAPAAAAPAAPATAAPAAATAAAAPAPAASAPATPTYATGLPSPAAQKLMHETGIANVAGTGRDGRVTKADVIQQAQQAPPAPHAPAAPAAKPPATAPAAAFSRGEHREKMSKLRRTLAARLVAVKNETAMLTTFNEVDMGAILELRKKYKDSFKEKHDIGLGFMSFFSKACSEALREFPQVNAFIDGDDLVFHDYVDLGVAVSTDRGLMVPVIRNAESLGLAQIESRIAELAGRARQGRLSIDEMTGGTFTITNGGVFGSLMSTPILNPPQSAILGMHKIQERPMVVNGQVVVRPMMYLALSYDHRVIDGKESVSFLVRVKDYLEDPVRLLLGV